MNPSKVSTSNKMELFGIPGDLTNSCKIDDESILLFDLNYLTNGGRSLILSLDSSQSLNRKRTYAYIEYFTE